MYRAIQFALLAAAMTALPLATRAATTTQILASPRNYDGQHVEVTGRIWHPRIVTEANGATFVRFMLCYGRCVRVFASGRPSLISGATITLRGTYFLRTNIGGRNVVNVIEADPGSL
jgi:hypothetical protein